MHNLKIQAFAQWLHSIIPDMYQIGCNVINVLNYVESSPFNFGLLADQPQKNKYHCRMLDVGAVLFIQMIKLRDYSIRPRSSIFTIFCTNTINYAIIESLKFSSTTSTALQISALYFPGTLTVWPPLMTGPVISPAPASTPSQTPTRSSIMRTLLSLTPY